MGALRVVTVGPNDLPPNEQDGRYAVVLGDLVLPGHILGRYFTVAEADDACRKFGEHYGLKFYVYNGPWQKRANFVVIDGGRS